MVGGEFRIILQFGGKERGKKVRNNTVEMDTLKISQIKTPFSLCLKIKEKQ